MSMPCLCLCLPLAPMKFCLGMDLSGKICQTLVLSMWKSQVLRSAHKKKDHGQTQQIIHDFR